MQPPQLPTHLRGVLPRLGKDAAGQAVGLLQQRLKQVLRLNDLGMAVWGGTQRGGVQPAGRSWGCCTARAAEARLPPPPPRVCTARRPQLVAGTYLLAVAAGDVGG